MRIRYLCGFINIGQTGQVEPFSFLPNEMIREMGEAYDLFFITGPGIQAVLYLGIIPKEEDFREMTEEEYEDYLKECPNEAGERMYILEAKDRGVDAGGLLCMTETERSYLLEGVRAIHHLTRDKTFDNDEEKLRYVANTLPSVFSEGSRFGREKH